VEHFRAACPRCQSLILILPVQTKSRRQVSHRKWYDRVHQVVQCPRCHVSYQVGLLFYPYLVGANRRTPLDVQPTKRELAELRNLAGGWWMRDEVARTTSAVQIGSTHGLVEIPAVNLYVPEPCTCAPLPWRASCAVHGSEVVGPDDQSGG
jgi:hypothetical protein